MTSATKLETKPTIDLSKIVELARASYPKKEAGLAKQISTGTDVIKPTDDSDFILWRSSDHWQKLTGLKGIPLGRLIQFSGSPDSGKSTHAMQFMVEAQQQGFVVILWDAEGKFVPERFASMGGNIKDLILITSNNMEEGPEAIAHTVNAIKQLYPEIKVFAVWDSVGATLNTKEDDEETEKNSAQPGVDARETAKAVKKFNKLIFKHFNKETGKHSIAFCIVNQIYTTFAMGRTGTKEKGGNQLYFLSSLILNFTRKSDLNRIKSGTKMKYGIVSKVKSRKNHLFSGNECVAELELEVSANGIKLYEKGKKDGEVSYEEDDSDD